MKKNRIASCKRKTKETNDLMKIINDWDITENEKKPISN